MAPETETEERARTRHALETLSGWGQDPTSDGGETSRSAWSVRAGSATRCW